ncbi:hypothetical protein NHX12_029436 [Muraenolepis orangiensis]|uniref:C2H2-type domain-containing protein n=1 Tax=Muraenolepis orangiensis TaxID=630683 RepID=A0A9Q0EFC4_9TELE|nr:hypothetical protein NHX12_029436 [Muraenolepis orangiensis]
MAAAETLNGLLHSFPASGLADGRNAVRLGPPGGPLLLWSLATEQRESAESWWGHLTSNVPRQTPVQSYQCSHCVLIFTSKLVLLEHLDKVHELDVYDALRHATSSATDDAAQNVEPKNDNPGDICASTSLPEEKVIPGMLSKGSVKKDVENRTFHTAESTSRDACDEAAQTKKRKITQCLTISSVANVKSPNDIRVANTAKKTLITQKRYLVYQTKDYSAPYTNRSEMDTQLLTDRAETVLDNSAIPPKKLKQGLIKIQLPTGKSHFQESCGLSLDFSDDEEDYTSPNDKVNHKEPHGNTDIAPTEELEANPSKQPPVQVEFYKCDSCAFGHKSVVAMLVHYQKHHVNLSVTLDQIKHSRCFLSDTKSEYLNINSPNQTDKPMASSHQNASSDFSEKTKDKSSGAEASSDGLKDQVDCEQQTIKKEVKDQASGGNRLKKWFFCPTCHYGNRYLKAMLIHHSLGHKCKITANAISIYTASLHRRMKKSKSQNDGITVLSSGLPLPILQGEGMFFCYICNYANKLVTRVLEHRKDSHSVSKKVTRPARELVLAYTAEVYDQPREEQLKFEANQILKVSVDPPSLVQSEIENVQTSLPGNSIPVSEQTEKNEIQPFMHHPFICPKKKCAYAVSSVYLFKKHARRKHLINQTEARILGTAFDKGFIKEGYYCQWCIFSDKSAEKVHEHCKQKHKSQTISLSRIIECLHAPPTDATSKKPIHVESPVPSQGSESEDHWTSLPLLLTPSSEPYMCRVCTASFSTQHGLSVHYGMKHINESLSPPTVNGYDEAAANAGDTLVSLVFKCPCCRYVHTTTDRIASHYLKKHSTKKLTAQGFESVEALFPQDCKSKRRAPGRVRLGGYLCQLCQEVHHSLEKMNVHYSEHHSNDVPSSPEPASKCALTKQLRAKYLGAQGSGLQKNQPGPRKCPYCKHVYKGKDAFTKHVKSCRGNKSKRHVFKCSICSYVALWAKHLTKHYRLSHAVQFNASAMERTGVGYNCRLCKYVASRGSYLVSHYTKAHGVEGPEVFKDHDSFQCKKCKKLKMFSSYNQLSIHYTSFHRNHIKMDFSVRHCSSVKIAVASYTCRQCSVRLESLKELCCHLDEHQERRRKTVEGSHVAATTSIQCDGTELRTGPALQEEAQACKQCGRRFTSAKDLCVHVCSHDTASAPRPPAPRPGALPEDVFNSHTSFRPWTLKPFYCCICSYRTNVLCLLKSHFRIKHSDSVYLEPAEVQRQLSHYRSMAPGSSSVAPVLPDVELLHCEFCDFFSEHQSSLRRHYTNIHGRRLLRCRDCSFFTGIRKTLEMHKKMGHSTCPTEPTHKRTLRCPLCLYHTKNQNHMIDHVVLHRQERVVPMEVRRPHLSRYLVGVVFRCHECTFTCGSAANLTTHALKHHSARPYQCRLCFFDCALLSELEAHLCDKHQVLRNHELVGQLNLDHQEPGPRPEGGDEGPRPEGGDEGPRPEGGDEGPRPEGGDEGPRPEGGDEGPRPEGGDEGPRPEGGDEGPRPEGGDEGPRPRGDEEGPRPRGDEESPRPRGDEEGPRPRGDEEGPQLGGDEEGPQLGGDNESPQPGGDNESPQPGGDNESPQPRGDNESPQPGGDEEGPQLGGDEEGPQLGGDEEGPQLGGDEEGPQLGGDEKGPQLGGDKELQGKVSELGDKGTMCTSRNKVPNGRPAHKDESLLDTEAQKSSTTSEATRVKNAETLLEKPLLNLEEQQVHRHKCEDGLESPETLEMPVLENVYLSPRNQTAITPGAPDAANESLCDLPQRRDAPEGTPVNKRPIQGDGGTPQAQTMSSNGTTVEHAADSPRPIAEDGRFSCTLCGRILSNSHQLQHHIKRHGM